jgi:hypothetical protein
MIARTYGIAKQLAEKLTDVFTAVQECLHYRGRAALQGRVTPLKSCWALALVLAVPRQIDFFRNGKAMP